MNGITWFILFGIVNVAADMIIKIVGNIIPEQNLIFFRYLFAFLFVLPFYSRINFSIKALLTRHLIRGVLFFLGLTCWIRGIKEAPLFVATIISFDSPLINTLFSKIFLKENVEKNIVIANIVGLSGIAVIAAKEISGSVQIRPILYLIMSGLFFCSLDIVNKKILSSVKNEDEISMTFYYSLVLLIVSTISRRPVISSEFFTVKIISCLIFLAISFNIMSFCLLKAFSKSDIYILQPFKYIEIITSTLLSYFIFGQYMNIHHLIGAIIIISASLYSVMKRKQAQ